jgi:murein DD-endopeptidase MepM/ murein hydrolase activator NlpD
VFLAALAPELKPAAAEDRVELKGEFVQGGLVLARARPGSEVRLDGRPLRVDSQGRFLFGFGRDQPGEASLEVRHENGELELLELRVASRRYGTEAVTGLAEAMVTPPLKEMKRIEREAELIRKARERESLEPLIVADFAWPARGPVTGFYGSRRLLNGEERRPHYGLDIAAPRGSPVIAANGGAIVLAEKDFYFSGGTVIIDHGLGLSSTYSHLEKLRVKQGQRVRRGDLIGTVGASGRALGPHLDWRANWLNTRLDPLLLLPKSERVEDPSLPAEQRE